MRRYVIRNTLEYTDHESNPNTNTNTSLLTCVRRLVLNNKEAICYLSCVNSSYLDQSVALTFTRIKCITNGKLI